MESEASGGELLLSCLLSLGALIGMGVFCVLRKARAEFFESFFSGLFLGVGGVAAVTIAGEALSGNYSWWDSFLTLIPIACAVCGWLSLWWKLRRRCRAG